MRRRRRRACTCCGYDKGSVVEVAHKGIVCKFVQISVKRSGNSIWLLMGGDNFVVCVVCWCCLGQGHILGKQVSKRGVGVWEDLIIISVHFLKIVVPLDLSEVVPSSPTSNVIESDRKPIVEVHELFLLTVLRNAAVNLSDHREQSIIWLSISFVHEFSVHVIRLAKSDGNLKFKLVSIAHS